ncbi:MAG: 30S ribosomal protein S20 [Phycisphaerales bacterium]|nr:30S ribosomal protein S20 [Phycisphaerales bacterium]
MAHSLSAAKRVRQNAKQRARNRWRERTMRDAIKEFETKIESGTAAEAKAAFEKVQKVIDRTAKRGTIHKNQASRRKSRLNAKLVAKTGGAAPKPAAKAAKAPKAKA